MEDNPMNKESNQDFFEQLHPWLKSHPAVMAILPLLLGFFFLLSAIFNWDFLLSPRGTFRGFGGITAYIGRGTARIICAIAGLILLYVAYLMFISKTW